jgi:hypothetical protein
VEHGGSGWSLHFLTGVLLGLVAIAATAFLSDLPAVVRLDHLGDDLAQTVYVQGRPTLPADTRVVLLDLDFNHPSDPGASEVAVITQAIKWLTTEGPSAIVLDQVIRETVAPPVMRDFIDAVTSAAKRNIRIVLPPVAQVADSVQRNKLVHHDELHEVADEAPVNVLRNIRNVRFASPLLLSDVDGVVRSVPRSVCLTWPDGTPQIVPSLATSLATATPQGCRDALQIIYSISERSSGLPGVQSPGETSPVSSAEFHWITASPAKGLPSADSDAEYVRGAVVMIGETGPAAWEDRHATPVGIMHGALIQVNALLRPASPIAPVDVSGWERGLLTMTSLLVGAFSFRARRHLSGVVSQASGRIEKLRDSLAILAITLLAIPASCAVLWLLQAVVLRDTSWADPLKLLMELLSVVVAAALFASYAVLAGYVCSRSGLPPFVVAALRCVFFLLIASAVILSIATVLVVLGATLLPLGIRVASLVPVVAASLEALIKAGGTLIANLERGVKWAIGATATLVLILCGPIPAEAQTASETPPPQESSSQPANVFTRSLDAFLHLVFASEPSPGPTQGAGVRIRGGAHAESLSWLPTLPVDQARLPAGSDGLALAWRAGAPPYVVTLEGETSGAALGSFRTGEHLLWSPQFRMPGEPVIVSVRDSDRSRLSATLVPADHAPPDAAPPDGASGDPAVAAMRLFVDGGESWRLEAVRRLASLAATSQPAAEALAGLRRAAAGGAQQ